MELFPQQESLKWSQYDNLSERNPFLTDAQILYVCNYHCFVLTVDYRETVQGRKNPVPYHAGVSLSSWLQNLNEKDRIIHIMSQTSIPFWESGSPDCFATLQDAQDYCVRVVNLCLDIMKGIPMIEEKSFIRSEN